MCWFEKYLWKTQVVDAVVCCWCLFKYYLSTYYVYLKKSSYDVSLCGMCLTQFSEWKERAESKCYRQNKNNQKHSPSHIEFCFFPTKNKHQKKITSDMWDADDASRSPSSLSIQTNCFWLDTNLGRILIFCLL